MSCTRLIYLYVVIVCGKNMNQSYEEVQMTLKTIFTFHFSVSHFINTDLIISLYILRKFSDESEFISDVFRYGFISVKCVIFGC